MRDAVAVAPQKPLPVRRSDALAFGWVGFSARMAEREGLSIREALIDAGVAARIDDDTPVSPAAFMLMCILVINGVDDEMHGVSRTRMARGTAATASFAMASQPTLLDGIHKMARFFEQLNGQCVLRLVRRGGIARIEIGCAAPDENAGAIVEEMMAHYIHHQLSYFVGFRPPLTLFTSRAAHHPAMFARHPYLLCPVDHGRITALSFPARYLDFDGPAARSDTPLWDAQRIWLQDHPSMTADMAAVAVDTPLAREVHTYLLEANASEEACCARLRMSRTEFKRSLAAMGTNFRTLRRKALITRIRPYIESGMMVEDVALKIGYSDARSLRRAVKLAGGGSIRELRRNNSHGQSSLMSQLHAQTLLMS